MTHVRPFTGEQVLFAYGMGDVDVGRNFGILVGMIVFYRIVGYMCLRFARLNREQR
jgi:hypothetical protein